MEKENAEQGGKSGKNKERSIAYPSAPLEEVVGYMELLRKSMGKGPFTREQIAEGVGHPGLNGTSTRKVAALVHFGLLTKDGTSYYPSQISEQIINFITEEERQQALVEAVKSPTLYSTLISEYLGQPVPQMLGKILIRRGVTVNVAESVANDFRKSLDYAGLIKDGVVTDGQNPNNDKKGAETKGNAGEQGKTKDAFPTGNYPVYLPSGIVVSFPESLKYSVAFGKFGEVLGTLNEIADVEIKNLEGDKE